MTKRQNPQTPQGAANAYMDSLPKQTRHTMRKKSGWRAVFIIAVIVLLVSLGALGAIALSYFQGQQKYESLAEYVESGSDPMEARIDWEGLRAVNPNTVAWVYIPNTSINYPVVRGDDNDYYLNHDFEGDEGWLANFGTIFMDYRNLPNWSDQSYYLYGHHMNDGSMFADIAAMADQSRFDDERIVYLYSPSGNFKLRSYSLIHCSADDSLVQVIFNDSQEMAAYVQGIIDQSIVNVGDIPAASQITKSFAFSTCDNYSVGRFVLFAYVEQTTVREMGGRRVEAPTGTAQSQVSDIPVPDEAAEKIEQVAGNGSAE